MKSPRAKNDKFGFIFSLSGLTPADAHPLADKVGNQSGDNHHQGGHERHHGSALELPAESIVERKQRHGARLAGAQEDYGTDIPGRRHKAEQADHDQRRGEQRDQHAAGRLQPGSTRASSRLFKLGPQLHEHALRNLHSKRHALDEQRNNEKVNRAVEKQQDSSFENSPEKSQTHENSRNRPG